MTVLIRNHPGVLNVIQSHMQTFVQRVKPIHFFFLTGLKAGISSVYEQESQTGSLFSYPEKKKKKKRYSLCTSGPHGSGVFTFDMIRVRIGVRPHVILPLAQQALTPRPTKIHRLNDGTAYISTTYKCQSHRLPQICFSFIIRSD